MKTKKISFIFFTLFLTLLNFHTISPNILTDSLIKTGVSINDHAFVENLKVGDEVLSCKFKSWIMENFVLNLLKFQSKKLEK